jgi:photosystem II stability/assembly factor-like uncharacterized protein
MVGAGFVDGIVFHPTAKGVRYARTDMGGAYRWDARAGQWMPILDWVSYPDLNLMGVESIAIDPVDARRVYLACGTYTSPTTPDGAILRSSDGGRTFQRTNVPFKFGGNENGRGNGERMMVDPNDGRVLFLGTRQAGLWRSADGAVTWKKVESFPWTPSGRSAGIVATLFDPRSGSRGAPSSTVYAAVSDAAVPSILRSTDAGVTWQPVPGQPTGLLPTHMILAADGTLYVTLGSSPGPSQMTNGAVWKLDTKSGAWTDITPDRPDGTRRFGYAAVSVQRDRPNVIIVSSFSRPGGEQIFRSLDGGQTWKAIIGGKETYDFRKAPYTARTGIHWLFDIEIDPANPNHAIFTTGYGGHETFNLTDADRGKPVRWQIMSKGIEESVALDLESPTKGAHLISGIGDYGGFVHWNLDRPEPAGNHFNPHFGNTDSVAAAFLAPNVVVRVGRASGRQAGPNIGYSLDYGRSWQPAAMPEPSAANGHVAVSSDGSAWVWSVRRTSFVTRDEGKTWAECQGLPGGTRVIADGLDPRRFYALDLFGGKLFASEDGGTSFQARPISLRGGLPLPGNRGDGRGGQDRLYATPGRTNDLWLAAYDGLHHSSDGGAHFTRLPGVQEMHAFGFGHPAPNRPDPALYMVGVVDGLRGIFRSDDAARHWIRINDDEHQWGLVLQITGDPKQFGRVYVGTHGRGTFYGDPR